MNIQTNVPEEIQRTAIAAANSAYGAVYGLDGDVDADSGADDPVADRIWQETYDGVVEELMEESRCAAILAATYEAQSSRSWSEVVQKLLEGGTYSARETSYLLYLAGELDRIDN